MNYIIVVIGGILTLLSTTVKIYFDPTFAVLPLSPTLKRTFSLAIFVVMGIIRDGLFTTLPWYSPFLLTLAVITLSRLSFSWVLVALASSGYYILDVILRTLLWKSNFSATVLLITLCIIWLITYAQYRISS
ncbi:MAG: hypothetical protein ABIL16_08370 [candidate division WOR-3 bacterium]